MLTLICLLLLTKAEEVDDSMQLAQSRKDADLECSEIIPIIGRMAECTTMAGKKYCHAKIGALVRLSPQALL